MTAERTAFQIARQHDYDILTDACANFCGARSRSGERKMAYMTEAGAHEAKLIADLKNPDTYLVYECHIVVLELGRDTPRHWHIATDRTR